MGKLPGAEYLDNLDVNLRHLRLSYIGLQGRGNLLRAEDVMTALFLKLKLH